MQNRSQSPIRAVIFDLDGTLLDTIDDLTDSMNAMLAARGWPPHDTERMKRWIGGGVEELVRRALPAGTPEGDLADHIRRYRDEYAKRWANKSRPLSGD